MCKYHMIGWAVVLAAVSGFLVPVARADEQVVLTWESAGRITFSELTNAVSYRVEWASSPDGPWQDFSKYAEHGLDGIPATGAGVVTATVPMLYRVVATEVERQPVPMILINGGTFQMGDHYGEGVPWELPVHEVTLDSFYIGETPVTEAQWRHVYVWAIANGYSFDQAGGGKAANYPASWITWYDIVKWCNAKSEMDELTPCYTVDAGSVYKADRRDDVVCDWTANGYRLPTEAEWEFAARGGLTTNRFPWGDRIGHAQANYFVWCTNGEFKLEYDDGPSCGSHPDYSSSSFAVSPMYAFSTNGYGLYDVAGNVFEWVWDWLDGTYYSVSPSSNPRGPDAGESRVVRGGSFNSHAGTCRVAYRLFYPPSLYGPAHGFRLARSDVD